MMTLVWILVQSSKLGHLVHVSTVKSIKDLIAVNDLRDVEVKCKIRRCQASHLRGIEYPSRSR